jgi:hypothetical protein
MLMAESWPSPSAAGAAGSSFIDRSPPDGEPNAGRIRNQPEAPEGRVAGAAAEAMGVLIAS